MWRKEFKSDQCKRDEFQGYNKFIEEYKKINLKEIDVIGNTSLYNIG